VPQAPQIISISGERGKCKGNRVLGTGQLVNIAEAGRRLGVSRSMAYRLFATGEIPGLVRLPGAQLLVKWPAVEGWLTATR
jgi:excisionase family DNA binding protein